MKIQEIAALAGVSPSTVSRVFSHHPKISEEVRQRVLETAQKYNYHPRLSTKQRNIVLLTPDDSEYPAHSCVEMLVMALSSELPKRNFRIEILPRHNQERLSATQFYGAVAVGIDAGEVRDWSKQFSQPLVLLDRDLSAPVPGIWQVSSDEMQALDLAVGHFKEHNIRKIGCVVHGKPGLGNAELRFRAARTALKKYGYPAGDELLFFDTQGSYVEIVGKLLNQGIDALLCPGGSGGIMAAYALNLFGRRVPDDISLIATEQSFFSPYATPPQTTISPDYKQLASKAADVFNAVLDSRPFPARTILPYRLIPRESVRRA